MDIPSCRDCDIAIIGMSGRFPGADNLDEFWKNLTLERECIRFFTPEELVASGISYTTLQDSHYVRACGFLDQADTFDAEFFGISPREAEIMDPQQRLFLECCWHGLENSGYNPYSCKQTIGVYAGMGKNFYLWHNLMPRKDLLHSIGTYAMMTANEKDFLSTRISYKLNLRGPSMTVQTACSTSLSAVHLACQALLAYECSMALAGGITIRVPLVGGYFYRPDGITSPDGHCRAFDIHANGMVPGSGMGVVILKRMKDALRDHDCIRAVIKGTSMNNDGGEKLGFTAPSITGQATVIIQALGVAEISPDTISYMEAHGTGTALGDPMEITAATQAFRMHTQRTQFCGIGSVKTNIGHLDVAAGIAGLIKTVLALEHQILPASLHFSAPNPKMKIEESPFFVVKKTRPWISLSNDPLRAGVTSLGIGGTNVHVILEQAPSEIPNIIPGTSPIELLLADKKNKPSQADKPKQTDNAQDTVKTKPEYSPLQIPNAPSCIQKTRPESPHLQLPSKKIKQPQLLTLSAKTPKALQMMLTAWKSYFSAARHLLWQDVCFSQNIRHQQFKYRFFVISPSATTLSSVAMPSDNLAEDKSIPPVYMILPQTSIPEHVFAIIQQKFPYITKICQECVEIIQSLEKSTTDQTVYKLLLQSESKPLLSSPKTAWLYYVYQWIHNYAIARLWLDWGIRPTGLIGGQFSEWTSAILSGVISLQNGLVVVCQMAKFLPQPVELNTSQSTTLSLQTVLQGLKEPQTISPKIELPITTQAELQPTAPNLKPPITIADMPQPTSPKATLQTLAEQLATTNSAHTETMVSSAPDLIEIQIYANESQALGLLADVPDYWITSIHANNTCTVMGGNNHARWITKLQSLGIRYKISRVPATLSQSMACPNLITPFLDTLASQLATFNFQQPQIPILSNLTGTWLSGQEACDPAYWCNQLAYPSRLGRGIVTLQQNNPNALWLELGNGDWLSHYSPSLIHSLASISAQNQEKTKPAEQSQATGEPQYQTASALQHQATGAPQHQTASTSQTAHSQSVSQNILPISRQAKTPASKAKDMIADIVLQNLLTSLGEIWQAGYDIVWNRFYHGQDHHKVGTLPEYPFQHQRYWIDSAIEPTSQKIATSQETVSIQANLNSNISRQNITEQTWFYAPVWRQTLVRTMPSNEPENWLIIARQIPIALQNAAPKCNISLYSYQPNCNFIDVFKLWPKTHTLNVILFLVAPDDLPILDQANSQAQGKDNLTIPDNMAEASLRLLQALDTLPHIHPQRIVWLCTHLWQIQDNEVIQLSQGWFPGFIRCASREYPKQNLYCIDSGPTTNYDLARWTVILQYIKQEPVHYHSSSPNLPSSLKANSLTANLINSPTANLDSSGLPMGLSDIAYRGSKRWVRNWQSVSLSASQSVSLSASQSVSPSTSTMRFDISNIPIRQNGVYLITGGLGGIGMTLARFLVEKYQARLILISRSGASDHVTSNIDDHPELQNILQTNKIISLDIADSLAIHSALSDIQKEWGMIHGVIHAAGISGGGMIATQTWEKYLSLLRAKVQGLQTLLSYFANQTLDWMVLCSSVSALFGTVGQSDYASANSILDIASQSKMPFPIITIHWDIWKEVGMAIHTPVPARLAESRSQSIAQYGISCQEGIQGFCSVLQSQLTNIVVAPHRRLNLYNTLIQSGDMDNYSIHTGENINVSTSPLILNSGKNANSANPTTYVLPTTTQSDFVQSTLAQSNNVHSTLAQSDFVQLPKPQFSDISTPSFAMSAQAFAIPTLPSEISTPVLPTFEISAPALPPISKVSTPTLPPTSKVSAPNPIANLVLRPKPAHLQKNFVQAQTVLEHKLVEIWQEFLGFQDIGCQDNFLDLGGDSLLAIQVLAQINTQLDIVCSLGEFLKNPTIAYLANKPQEKSAPI